MATKVPKKISVTKKTFISRLENAMDRPSISPFIAFPKKTSFNGQEKKENIILIVRQHPAVYLGQMLLVVGMIIFGVIFSAVISNLGIEGGSGVALSSGAFVFFLAMAITIAFDTFARWFYTVNIITDQRIVDVDFINVLRHEFSEAQLEKIEDVTHSVSGLLGTIFDFGTVTIQTAGAQPEFQFNNVPRPRDVQDTLFDLVELKQTGEL